jgi:hypothetical protein
MRAPLRLDTWPKMFCSRSRPLPFRQPLHYGVFREIDLAICPGLALTRCPCRVTAEV